MDRSTPRTSPARRLPSPACTAAGVAGAALPSRTTASATAWSSSRGCGRTPRAIHRTRERALESAGRSPRRQQHMTVHAAVVGGDRNRRLGGMALSSPPARRQLHRCRGSTAAVERRQGLPGQRGIGWIWRLVDGDKDLDGPELATHAQFTNQDVVWLLEHKARAVERSICLVRLGVANSLTCVLIALVRRRHRATLTQASHLQAVYDNLTPEAKARKESQHQSVPARGVCIHFRLARWGLLSGPPACEFGIQKWIMTRSRTSTGERASIHTPACSACVRPRAPATFRCTSAALARARGRRRSAKQMRTFRRFPYMFMFLL